MVDSDRIDALGRALGVRVIIIVSECIDDLYLGEVRYICSFLDVNLHTSFEQIQIPGKDRLEFGRVPRSDVIRFSGIFKLLSGILDLSIRHPALFSGI